MTWGRCEACGHPAREGIEKKLRNGKSVREVAEEYGIEKDQLRRHREKHMVSGVAGVVEALKAEASRNPVVLRRSVTDGVAIPLAGRMDPEHLYAEHDACIAEAKELIDFCKQKGAEDTRGWALGVREWRGCLDQKNRMLGLYDQVDPRLQRAYASRVIQVVSRALEQYPEAKEQVLLAIDEVERGGNG